MNYSSTSDLTEELTEEKTMPSVNLWEVMVRSDDCAEVTKNASKGSANPYQELVLEVTDSSWKIDIFGADCTTVGVSLTLFKHGGITVKRTQSLSDNVSSTQSISF